MPAETAAEALKCPHGEPIEETRGGEGPGVRCQIANTTLTREKDSRSLMTFCANADGYCDCPIQRRARRKFYDDQHRALRRELVAATPRSER